MCRLVFNKLMQVLVSTIAIQVLFFSTAFAQVANYADPGMGTGQHKEEIVWLTWDHVFTGNFQTSGLQDGTSTGSIRNGVPYNFTLPSNADFPGAATLTATFNNVSYNPTQGLGFGTPLCGSTDRKNCGYQPGNMQPDPPLNQPGLNFNNSAGSNGIDNSWQGSAMQYGYNIPGREILFSNIGSGPLNEPGQDGQRMSFDVTLSLQVGGLTLPVDFIFSDAETTNGSQSGGFDESIRAITQAGADPWQLIEVVGSRYNGTATGGTTQGTNFQVSGLGSNTVTIEDTEVGWGSGSNAVPVLLANNTTNVSYSFRFGGDNNTSNTNGHQGILIGMLFPKDHGDAPASFGHVAHYQDMNAGPATTLVNASNLSLGTLNSADNEQVSQFSADATGDDGDAAGDDEDAFTTFPQYDNSGTYTLTVPFANQTGSSATLCGWIDFNLNNVFDDGSNEEVCATATNGGSTVSLSFTGIPTDFDGSEDFFARFRICSTASQCNVPTGLAADGEVEDYLLALGTLPVTLSSISNEVTDSKVKVDWTTSSELFNVGYQLWGLDGHDSKWEKLHAWLVRSGSGNAVEPQSYSRTATIPGSVKDLVAIGISSVDSDGSEHYYGPFELNQSYGDLTQLKPIGWNHIRAEVDASMTSKGYVKDRVNGYRRLTAASAADSETVMDITVADSGLYRITSSELAAAGMDVSAIKNRQIAIIDHSGAPVVRYVWARGSGLGLNKTLGVSGEVYFYGQSPDEHAGLYSNVSHYRLVVDKTKALIAPLQGKQGISSGFSETYREQLLVEVDTQYTLAAQANDPWVERVMVSYANHTSVASKQLDLPGGVDQSQGVDLLIGVGRGSGLNPIDANGDGIQDPEHIITGAVADESGAAVWQTPVSAVGTGVWQARIPVNTVLGDVDALTPGLQVNVGASFSAGSGYRFSEIQLDTMGLEYARSYTPKADQLHLSFTGPNEGESGYAVQMPDRGYAMVFAYNEAGALVRLVPESQVRQTLNGEKVRLVKFAPLVGAGTQGSDVRYWLSSKPGYLKAGLSVDTLASQASLVAQAQGADFLMIAHPAFMGAELEGYALHKQGQGYRTAIVDYSEIVRVYGGGQAGPEGLTQYIRAVEAAGDLSAVLLIGSSVYDHLDRLGTDSMTFIPGHYGESNYSRFTVSDVPYITGADGTLFASMGRWPVRELSELNTIIAKSINWSNTDHTNAEALLIAEHTVAGENIDFAGAMESNLSPIVPASMTTNRVYVDDILDAHPGYTLTQALNEAKGQIISGLNNTPSVVLYNGHGTTSQLSNKGLFKSSDVNSVTASGAEMWLPMSCYVTYYESTHVNTLAHQLMFSGNAVNISGAMLLSNQGGNIAAGKAILDGTVNQGKTLGEAVNEHKAHQDDPKLNINWAVLGDPTQRM